MNTLAMGLTLNYMPCHVTLTCTDTDHIRIITSGQYHTILGPEVDSPWSRSGVLCSGRRQVTVPDSSLAFLNRSLLRALTFLVLLSSSHSP